MNGQPEPEETTQYLEEASYYLLKKGLTVEQVSKALEVSQQDAERLSKQFESRISSGKVTENEVDRNLWEDVYNDSVGNEKITFVKENGFYHCRRSDLESMDSTSLMAIFESSKQFLDFDMYKPYLNSKPPAGYDPMAMQRQIKKAVEIIEALLKRRWEGEKAK